MSLPGGSEEGHKCVFCSQRFSTKTDLQNHFRLHANGEIDIKGQPRVQHKTPEKQDVGSVEESSGKEDVATTKDATTKNNAVCDVCGEVFRTVSLAISHKFRKHPESVIKHYCPHCGMMFPIKLNRDKHLLTHPGTAPKQLFPCHPCGVAFYNQRAKKFHMDSAHKGAIRMVNPIKTPAPSMKIVVNNAGEAHSVYYCHLCGCEYQVKYNLQKHLATKHAEEEREALPEELVQCNLCSAVFYTKRAYEAHSHHHRDGDLFATNEQMRQQVVQRIDQDFDQRRVPTAVERYLSASAVSSNRSATWRNIQAARRAHHHYHHLHQSPSPRSNQEEGVDMPSSPREAESPGGDAGCPLLSRSSAGGREDPQEEYLCWGSGETTVGKKRMMDDPEEDDEGDMRSLGTVNPDSVMSNPRVMLGEAAVTPLGDCSEDQTGDADKSDKRQRVTETDEQLCHASPTQGERASGLGELVVEKVVGVRQVGQGREFLVRWRGLEVAHDTWESETDLLNCALLISEFMKSRKVVEIEDAGEPGTEAAVGWCKAPRHRQLMEDCTSSFPITTCYHPSKDAPLILLDHSRHSSSVLC